MSSRICIPSKLILRAASYARSRAWPASGPKPVTPKHAAAGGHDAPLVVARGPGMRDLDAVDGRSLVEPRDHVALRCGRRVAGGGEHHGHGPVVGEARLGAGEAARLAAREEQVGQVGAQPGKDGLRLRVAEAHVVLEHPGAGDRHHQARVEDAVEGRAAIRHRGDDRTVDQVGDLLHAVGADAGHRRVAAHAAGVRPLVAVEDSLVVLRRGERQHVGAVAERQQRELLALEVLLEEDLRRTEALLGEEHVHGVAGVLLGRADDHALAGGEPVGLQHRRIRAARERREGLVAAAQDAMAGGRHAGGRHQLLRVDLRALQARRGLARAESRDPGVGERVDQALDQGRLGPDDHQVDGLIARGGDQAGYVLGTDVQAPGVVSDAGVPRRAQQLRMPLGAGERPRDRMLAPAAADDQDPHGLDRVRGAARALRSP